ncbi:hypothetical protein B296_00006805 [Ensete ventricosum]|uniref:Uncharacterized protein n=1 Tax=Ensete ventricosum TaxID=4639 RepID=A0A427A519_ENSVE|nr:hypothetical protein B296_00006805 [Ensete ventricosum]
MCSNLATVNLSWSQVAATLSLLAAAAIVLLPTVITVVLLRVVDAAPSLSVTFTNDDVNLLLYKASRSWEESCDASTDELLNLVSQIAAFFGIIPFSLTSRKISVRDEFKAASGLKARVDQAFSVRASTATPEVVRRECVRLEVGRAHPPRGTMFGVGLGYVDRSPVGSPPSPRVGGAGDISSPGRSLGLPGCGRSYDIQFGPSSSTRMLYNFTRVAEWLARLRPNSDTQDGPCKLLPRTLSLHEVSQMRSPIPEEVDGGDGTVQNPSPSTSKRSPPSGSIPLLGRLHPQELLMLASLLLPRIAGVMLPNLYISMKTRIRCFDLLALDEAMSISLFLLCGGPVFLK